MQSYSQIVTEPDEENNIEAKTDVTETHFGTTYSSVIKDKSVSYTTGNNTVEYTSEEKDYQTVSESVKYNNINALSSNYSYDDNDNVINKTVSYKIDDIDEIANLVNEYDSEGKITATGYENVGIYYTYDANNQLTRTDNGNGGYTSTYSYDSRGNITNKTVNGTSTTFGYSNDGWNDKLIQVNNDSLTYDANGNVLTYGDKSFTWSSGRNLVQITDGDNTYSYTYDESGIRTSKTVNGLTTYYNTKDGVILSQTDGTNTMYFQYDTNGVPIGFIYNSTQYFYITNQMGDVIAITDENGNIIAEYQYDEWGTLLSIVTADYENDEQLALANTNPLRYRGYYYDTETGYYYLQSRYYDANICRFINSDLPGYALIQKNNYNGLNIFAYCCNEPISSTDHTGFANGIALGSTFASILFEIISSIVAPAAATNPVVIVVVVVSIFTLTFLLIIDPISLNTEKVDTNKTDAIAKADAKIKDKLEKGNNYYYNASRTKTKDGRNYVTIGKGINEKSALIRVKSKSQIRF